MMRSEFLVAILLVLLFSTGAIAQTSDFSYQGKVDVGGVPPNGNYDFEFRLFDALSGGTQVGTTATRAGVTVTSGNFSVLLSFPVVAPGGAFPGAARWLEIAVRPAGSGSYTTLAPRQQISSTPYAIKSLNSDNAANASQLGGLPPNRYVQTSQSGNASVSSLTVTSGPITFPDLTTQNTAGLTSVNRTAPLTGSGTAASPLGIQSPLDIRDLDRPTRQPVFFLGAQDGSAIYSVPAGKVLVIEYVSTWHLFEKGRNAMRIFAAGFTAYVAPEWCDEFGTTTVYQQCTYAKSLRLYITGPNDVRISLPYTAVETPVVTPVHVSGYLVNVL